MFRTQFQRERRRTQAGSRERVLYQLQADKEGALDLVAVGKESIWDYIQSFKESTDIHTILARFRNGEADVLNQRVGSFGDVSMMPTRFADVLNACIKGKEIFESLPKETREKFNNDFGRFMVAMDDPTGFAAKVGQDVATALGFVGSAAPEKAAETAAYSVQSAPEAINSQPAASAGSPEVNGNA